MDLLDADGIVGRSINKLPHMLVLGEIAISKIEFDLKFKKSVVGLQIWRLRRCNYLGTDLLRIFVGGHSAWVIL
jgi:hypothetical protein